MTKKKTAQSHKKAKQSQDPATAFAEDFFKQWQKQWQELLQQKGMPQTLEGMELPPGFVPLQNMGPMGLMAPMGAVAMANLKLLQDLQTRVKELEAIIATPAGTPAKKPAKKRIPVPKKRTR